MDEKDLDIWGNETDLDSNGVVDGNNGIDEEFIDVWDIRGNIVRLSNRSKLYKWLILFLVLVSFVAISYIGVLMYEKTKISLKVNESIAEVQPSLSVEEIDEALEVSYQFLDADLSSLIEKNGDVVAWVRVGSIGIDLPLTQTTDNDFYLNHDIDRNENTNGWVFVDSGSNIEHLGLNTVVYGHNLINYKMLGALKKLMDEDVYTQPDAGIIQLTTKTKQMVFKVCSVYITDYEDWEYVKTLFNGEVEKGNFIKMISDRNIVEEYRVSNLTTMDKFLTFSTCHGGYGTTQRFVVHAQLIAERSVN